VVAAFGAVMYLAEGTLWSRPTTRSFVRQKVTVNARVAGQAVEIAVRDNQRVRQGQVLFRIDPEAYQIAGRSGRGAAWQRAPPDRLA